MVSRWCPCPGDATDHGPRRHSPLAPKNSACRPVRIVLSISSARPKRLLSWLVSFVLKPVMSSSGKGQSVVRSAAELPAAWDYAQEGGRAGAGRCIVEGVDFDYEYHADGAGCRWGVLLSAGGSCQVKGDYRESWQPAAMSPEALAAAEQSLANGERIGGYGLFGVECFVRGDEVLFSEVSPRPRVPVW